MLGATVEKTVLRGFLMGEWGVGVGAGLFGHAHAMAQVMLT